MLNRRCLTGHQISEQMRSVRGLELVDRRNTYERDRIREQQKWYAGKSAWNQRRATYWGMGLLARIIQEGADYGRKKRASAWYKWLVNRHLPTTEALT